MMKNGGIGGAGAGGSWNFLIVPFHRDRSITLSADGWGAEKYPIVSSRRFYLNFSFFLLVLLATDAKVIIHLVVFCFGLIRPFWLP
jgi:hypothetical protein